MASMTGGQAVVEVLRQAGVTRVFGVPGESFMGVLDALYDSPIQYIATRHEGGGAFMASGYAKISGEIGVCSGTRAVGASNMAIGIHTARQDSTPMIALAGQVNRAFLGREAFQELDLVAVFSQYCKWAVEIDDAARVPELMERAVRMARGGRPGPVLVSLPEDMLRDQAEMRFRGSTPPAPPQPDLGALDQMLAALLRAARPAIVAGGGVLASPGAREALVQLAEAIEVPVLTIWRRHDAFPNDHRLSLGSAGLGQAPSVWQRLKDADVVLGIGTRFQELGTQGYRVPGPTSEVYQIDIDEQSVGRGIFPRAALISDAGAAIRAMLERLPDPIPGFQARVASNLADRAAFVEATTPRPGASAAGTVDPAAVIEAMNDLLPADAIVTTDAGNFYGWLSRYYRFRGRDTFVGPTSGAMGYGLPSAIGAKLARPQVPVVSLSGDGGFLMNVNELETAVRCGAAVIAIVFDNALYGTIKMHQERDHPGRPVGTTLSTPDLVALAASFGARGARLTEASEVRPALEEALNAQVPTVLHVMVDPERISVGSTLSALSGTGTPETGTSRRP